MARTMARNSFKKEKTYLNSTKFSNMIGSQLPLVIQISDYSSRIVAEVIGNLLANRNRTSIIIEILIIWNLKQKYLVSNKAKKKMVGQQISNLPVSHIETNQKILTTKKRTLYFK